MVRGPADLTLLFADLPRADRCADDDWVRAIDGVRAGLHRGRGTRRPGRGDGRQPGAGPGPRPGCGGAAGARPAGASRWRRCEAAAAIGRAWAAPPAEPVARPAASAGRIPRRSHRPGRAGARRGRGQGAAAPARGSGAGRRGLHAARPPRWRAAARIGAPGRGEGPRHGAQDRRSRRVRLGLRGARQVRAAAADLLARFPAVLVERMVTGGVAELLVGVEPDPVFGPVLTVGAGGVLTELLRDVAHLVLPAGPAEIRDALLGLRCSGLLTGHRGAQPAGPRRAGRHGGPGRRDRPATHRADLVGDQPDDRHDRRWRGPVTRWSPSIEEGG